MSGGGIGDDPGGTVADAIAAVFDPHVSLLPPGKPPRTLDEPRLLGIIPADQCHGLIDGAGRILIEDASRICGEGWSRFDRDSQGPVSTEGLLQLCDAWN